MKENFDDFLMRNPGTGSSKCKETGKISARKIRKKENWVEKEKKKGLFFRVLGGSESEDNEAHFEMWSPGNPTRQRLHFLPMNGGPLLKRER